MSILTLIIKQKYFNEILTGDKIIEYRNIMPTTVKKYCEFEEDGETLIGPREYSHIQFYVGYNTDRASALVEVIGTEIVIFEDENGKESIYTIDGQDYVESEIQYSLGAISNKINC